MRARIGLALAIAALLGATVDAGATEFDKAAAVLERAASAGRSLGFEGDLLWVTWGEHGSHSTVTAVASPAGEPAAIEPSPGAGQRGSTAGAGVPAPIGIGGLDRALLDDKYAVEVGDAAAMLDRDLTTVRFRLRASGALRERVWFDDTTGLVVRRETYDAAGERSRLGTYLSLAVADETVSEADGAGTARRPGQDTVMPHGDRIPVNERGLRALREAGWTVPDRLPGGYEAVGVYAKAGEDGQPLQVVYRDGLYVLSLFQQRGRADWTSLPGGAVESAALDWPAYEWPGAVPRRMVWEAAGATFTLVGDAPREDFESIAETLPRPHEPGVAERLARGFGRLWERVSSWE